MLLKKGTKRSNAKSMPCDSRTTVPNIGFYRCATPQNCYNTDKRETKRNRLSTFSLLIMRKIESQMCAAIQSSSNWTSSNTAVYFDETTSTSVVRLHGNKIAEITDDTMTIFDGGWQSTTTKSRLNALCDEFCVAGEGVFQKNYKWFVRKFTAQLGTEKVFTTEEFTNGYIFA